MKKKPFYKLSGSLTPEAHHVVKIRAAYLDMTQPLTIDVMARFVGKIFNSKLTENPELMGLWCDASEEVEAVYGQPEGEIVEE